MRIQSRQAITRQIDLTDPSHTQQFRVDITLHYDSGGLSRVTLGARSPGYPYRGCGSGQHCILKF